MPTVPKVVHFLVKICFIPVYFNPVERRLTFRVCSTETFLFFFIYMGLLSCLNISGFLAMHTVKEVVIEYYNNANIIDAISALLLGFLMSGLLPYSPLLLARGIPSVPAIFQAGDPKWPKHGVKHILSWLLLSSGYFIMNTSFWSQMLKRVDVPVHILSLIYVSPSLQQSLAPLYFVVPILVISAYMEKLIAMCNENAPGKEIQQARRCLEVYKAFESGFGPFFCFVFGVTQILMIFSFFMSFSRALGANEPVSVKVGSSFGTLLISFGLMLNIAGLTFTLESGYKSVKSLVKPLQEQLLVDASDRMIIKNSIKEIEDLNPLTGNGYFSISKGTLTSMLSVGITYIIILVQFKISAS